MTDIHPADLLADHVSQLLHEQTMSARQKLLAAQASGGLAPSATVMQPDQIDELLQGIPQRTASTQHSNLQGLRARFGRSFQMNPAHQPPVSY